MADLGPLLELALTCFLGGLGPAFPFCRPQFCLENECIVPILRVRELNPEE